MNFHVKANTAWRLGPRNILRVLKYRAGLRLGLHPVQRLSASPPVGPFFRKPAGTPVRLPARRGWWEFRADFSVEGAQIEGHPPAWLEVPGSPACPLRPWWEISDFDSSGADIKDVWEASRYDWVLASAQRAAIGEAEGLTRLNGWLSHWVENNPPYLGPNWKCGQEASIRVLHLATAAGILRQTADCLSGLRDLVTIHLKRIAPTQSYAKAQDNNHGTSEAAALFVGGSWLRLLGDARGQVWEAAGRKLLEERIEKLVAPDGTFSQYSVNYQRLLLDTVCMVELWRRRHGLDEFTPRFHARIQAATDWLHSLVCPRSGDAPNLGANDGARLFALTDATYRDFRPTVQLATALFAGKRAYEEEGHLHLHLQWLEVDVPESILESNATRHFEDGGLIVLARSNVRVVFRYPRFRFRPSHSDLLHVDLWHGAENLFRDGGTYRYADPRWHEYFSGVVAHNTVQFDNRDQMPRLGRFLFGAWPSARDLFADMANANEYACGAGYRDWKGAEHYRRLSLDGRGLRVEDKVSGFRHRAVIRWRLMPGPWKWDGDGLTDGKRVLRVSASVPIARKELVQGWESRHYSEKSELPVLEAEVQEPGSFLTELSIP